jgi:hypothetical protein
METGADREIKSRLGGSGPALVGVGTGVPCGDVVPAGKRSSGQARG